MIEIDPKMAFGTGTNETTQMMIQLMELFIKGNELVLDAGTGTAILSIVAKYMGAKRIYAFDNDAVTAECIRENIDRNGLEKDVMAFIGTIECIRLIQFDVILANINKSVILQIFNKMAELLKKNGVLIISGITIEHTIEIIAKAKEFDLDIIKLLCSGDWKAIAFGHEL